MPSTIEKLYQQELGRAPDPVGMEYWSNLLSSGMSEQDLANAIGLSPEAKIYDAYNAQLGRAPEDAGRDYWLDQATNQGVSIEDVISAPTDTTADGFVETLNSSGFTINRYLFSYIVSLTSFS